MPPQHKPSKASKAPKVIVGKVGTAAERLSLTWSKLLIGGCLALLPLGGILVGVQSSYISAVCQTLDNCANDQQAALVYQQSVRQAKTAQSLSEMAKNLPDLRLAHTQLSAAIAQLSGLSNDTKLAPMAQQRLTVYRGHLNNLDARLAKESKATELLRRAKVEAQQANELTTIAQKTQAQKTQDYEAARRQWAKALATLQAVQPSTFAQNQATARSQEYTARLKTLDLRIAALNPPSASPAQPINPFQPLVGESLTEPSRAVNSRTQLPRVAPPEKIADAPRVTGSRTAGSGTAASRTAASRTTVPRAIASQPAVSRLVVSQPSVSQSAAQSNISRPTALQTVALSERSQRIAAHSRSASAQPVAQASSPNRSRPQISAQNTAIAVAPPARLITSAPPATPSRDAVQQPLSQQTLNNVSIQLDDARVSPDGTVAANLVVENYSGRTFGFVPLFAEVQDANGNIVRSRVHFTNTEDGVAEPGEVLHGQVHMFNRQWNSSGSQNLALVIQEGTTGSRNFRLTF